MRTNDTSADRRTFLKAVGGVGVVSAGGTLSLVGRASAQDAITFGQPASLTGKWDFLQPAVSQSTDLALSEINEAGGPLDRQVNLQRRDTAVDPQQARQVVQQLKNNDDAMAILGLFSSEITPLFDFLKSQRVPIVTPWPGSTALDGRGGDKGTPQDLSDDDWVWRTIIGDTVHTIGAARKLLDEDMGRVGIINGTSQGERSWADAFQRAYENGDGTVAARVEVEEGKSTYQSELNRLFGNDFDAWALAVALDDAVTIVREWSTAGYGRQLLLEDGLRSADLIENAGEAADGAWIALAAGEGPGYDGFLSKYQQAGDADLHAWGVAAYDATNVTALAIERAGDASREAIERNLGPVSREGGTTVQTFAEGKQALADGNEINYQGAATPTDFTDFGNVFGDVGVERVTPDGFEQVDRIPTDDLKPLVETY
ncbi:ABC transporter substrate-binding protein [Halorussus salinisoli]|uniref:ABC transporter substrate-binding protein n=1 Tax=Halorussus salinisoli TaxID=2558242 RepID=UPI0010C224FD|nr:ABC transporter substrate-binding protein [Halorussus salinisoli]